jgi:ribosome biogenesis GTPase / thiamine phosphate phosphatase
MGEETALDSPRISNSHGTAHTPPLVPGTGLVIGKRRQRFEVIDPQGARRTCEVRGSLRQTSGREIVVGDRVELRPAGDGAVIAAVSPRKNEFTRRDPGARARLQVIAANLDQVLAVVSTEQPQPRWGLLDRILVTAEAAGIAAAVCVTKSEFWDERTLREALTPHVQAGYRVLAVSVRAGRGLDDLREHLAGRLSLFVGASGAGKTTLVGALTGGENLRTGPVSERTGKGRHTTTELDAHPFAGGWLIDTPGLRTFALPELDARAIGAAFPEIAAARDGCRFGAGCLHAQEPGCAVKAAVSAGHFDPRRYRSYLRMVGQDGAGGPADAGSPDVRKPRGRGRGDREDHVDADFTCRRCGAQVPGVVPGSAHRNHCPGCLWSRHVDHQPGDRAAGCEGNMEPVAVMVRADGEWALIHRCQACGALRTNRIAGDDNAAMLLSLVARPLARPPFPLERIGGAAQPADGRGD